MILKSLNNIKSIILSIIIFTYYFIRHILLNNKDKSNLYNVTYKVDSKKRENYFIGFILVKTSLFYWPYFNN